MSRQVLHDGAGSFEVRFPYDRSLVDLIKTLDQRRWNATDRFWAVPESEAVALVDLLREHGFSFDRATCELYRSLGGTADVAPAGSAPAAGPSARSQRGLFDAPEAAGPASGDLSVSRLNERIRDAIQSAFPAPVWLVGEISGFDKSAHRRHVSFELAERAEDGRAVSRVPTVLFAATRKLVDDALRRAGDPFRLQDEIEVRVRVSVGLYVPWGQYRVVIEELDVAYTLGEAARRREEIIRRLAAAGLLERNRGLPLPPTPLRLGVVTSIGSDAYNDVLRTLQESGYAFRVTVHGARVQGHATEPSVLNALDWFRQRADQFDVLLVCRGGGSRTDLVWFDSERLGRTIAEFPIPVVVGIGHEQDQSVLDAVARSCKTPTAAAGLIVETLRRAEEQLLDRASRVLRRAGSKIETERGRVAEGAARLVRAARTRLREERLDLSHRRKRTALGARALLGAAHDRLLRWSTLIPRDARRRLEQQLQFLAHAVRTIDRGARRDLRAAAENLARRVITLRPRSKAILARERERLRHRVHRLDLVDPKRVLERGYVILRLPSGRVLTGADQAPEGTGVAARLREGELLLISQGESTRD